MKTGHCTRNQSHSARNRSHSARNQKPQREEQKPEREEQKPEREEPKPQCEEPKPQQEEQKPQREEQKPQHEEQKSQEKAAGVHRKSESRRVKPKWPEPEEDLFGNLEELTETAKKERQEERQSQLKAAIEQLHALCKPKKLQFLQWKEFFPEGGISVGCPAGRIPV